MKLIAHRGGSGLRIENTLAAFANAIELDATGAELDVHLSRDGEVIVHHDDQLNINYCRHENGQWITPDEAQPIADLSYAELRQYDIGTPKPGTDYARQFNRIKSVPDQRIPLLRDVIRLLKARSKTFKLIIEIKTPMLIAADQTWQPLADATLAIIEAEHFLNRTIICSFDWGALRYIKQRRENIPTWLTTVPSSWFENGQPPATDIPPEPEELQTMREQHATGNAPWYAGFDPHRFNGRHAEAIAAAGGNAWFPFHRDFTQQAQNQLTKLKLNSAVWSVNLHDPTEIQRLTQTGVHYLVTDYPDITSPT